MFRANNCRVVGEHATWWATVCLSNVERRVPLALQYYVHFTYRARSIIAGYRQDTDSFYIDLGGSIHVQEDTSTLHVCIVSSRTTCPRCVLHICVHRWYASLIHIASNIPCVYSVKLSNAPLNIYIASSCWLFIDVCLTYAIVFKSFICVTHIKQFHNCTKLFPCIEHI